MSATSLSDTCKSSFATLNVSTEGPQLPELAFPPRVLEITEYGADGSRLQIALNTEAIQQTIDACAAAGGGTVWVPAGNFLTAPLTLRSNICLHLEKGATLVASSTEAQFRSTEANRHIAAENGWLPFLSIADAQNVAITGEGTIDGQGAVWWERWREHIRATGKKGGTDRPRLIYIVRSKDVLIEGLTLTHSPSFNIVMRHAENIEVRHTHIVSPFHAPNTDAIDPIDSRNIRITHNVIDCNDDHIAIKAEQADPRFPQGVVSNIYIAHNTLLQGRGISIGGETSGGVNNVLVAHNHFEGSMYGLRIKSSRGKGGQVRNIRYVDTTMVDVAVPLVLSGYYEAAPIARSEVDAILAKGGFMVGEQLYPPDTDPAQIYDINKTPDFAQIVIDGLTATGKINAAGYIVGVPEAPLRDLHFHNVHIEACHGLVVRNAKIHANRLQIKATLGPAWTLEKDGVINP
ncbi:glycoside hydrolase family 28 protein [Uliginosibacterium gangwonense]|uniref:glycoside hydrolase family 28 protein n=1 Tax=Uliginosibacterium gangwonense TaxID=392736 RepID=UPI00037B6A71|nr:glycoside hydrolase family 28 protein [Uliginosibacterium gangwonense]